MSVSSTHPQYDAMLSRWQMCRDASNGEHAVHLKRELYLPKFDKEEQKSYDLRLKMTPFFNATWRTVSGLKGMLFRKSPVVEVPKSLADDLNDIDLAGTTMQGLAQKVCQEALIVGRVGLLVDYPPAPAGATMRDAQELKLRAMIALYTAESIINWQTKRINGATILSMVVVKEDALLPGDDEFSYKCEERYRVLDLDASGFYRQRLFACDSVSKKDIQIGEDIYPMMKNAKLGFIPFVFIGIDCIGSDVEDPPLIDLVTTNFKHYGQATSYERGCFFSGLPTFVITGHEPDSSNPIYIGGNVALCLPNPSASAAYVEVQGDFNGLRTNLEDKKREMAVLGARFLEESKAGVESERALARRQSGDESQLSIMSQTASMGLTLALKWFVKWQIGEEGTVKYELTRDLMPEKMGAQELTAVVGAWQSGAISQETMFENLKAGEIIAAETTFAEEQARTNEQPPILSNKSATA